ncbi:TIGR03032 family protein [Candidatus Poribacteria bacterium]|nr:MAG: TIGR03032 family protein [Candidatus Poribacteria bacterium]
MNALLASFHYTHSPTLPKLLWELGCTLVFSTYQAGKVVFIRATSPEKIEQHALDFPRPMGLAVADQRIAVATREEVVVLANTSAEESTESVIGTAGTYVQEKTYFSGEVDTHDLAWGKDGLWAINTLLSSMALTDESSDFESQWRPPFVSDIAPEDRCHLNSMAMVDGRPEYVTAFGEVDTFEGWRENKVSGGIVMDVFSGEIVVEGLPMPHSPRVYDGKLYLLLSGTGELVCAEPETGGYEVVAQLPGFVRGMARCGDYLFVGLSKLRKTSSTFAALPISEQAVFSGIVVVSLSEGCIVEHLRYETGVEEIYDVQVLTERSAIDTTPSS